MYAASKLRRPFRPVRGHASGQPRIRAACSNCAPPLWRTQRVWIPGQRRHQERPHSSRFTCSGEGGEMTDSEERDPGLLRLTRSQKSRASGESSIFKGDDGRWHGFVSMGKKDNGRRDRRHVSAAKRADVVAKVRALEVKRDAGLVEAAGKP